MNQYEAADEIIRIIPAAKEELTASAQIKSAYTIVNIFTKHIRMLVEKNNQALLDRSLRLMNKIHERGDTLLQQAVENVFVFSWDSVTSSCNRTQRKLLAGMMPMGLYTIYVNQIYKSGI